jgi:hypothetical protein
MMIRPYRYRPPARKLSEAAVNQIVTACEDAIRRRLRPSIAYLQAACPGASAHQVERVRGEFLFARQITIDGLPRRNRLVGGWGGLHPVCEHARIVANYRAVRREKIARGEEPGAGPYPGVLGIVLDPGVA